MNSCKSLALSLLGFDDLFSDIEALQIAVWKDAERFSRRKNT